MSAYINLEAARLELNLAIPTLPEANLSICSVSRLDRFKFL